MSISSTSIQQLAINTIRTLSMDAVQQANSGHPGTPMALAPVAYSLWNEVLNYDPAAPDWPGRDRFVLSCGHASMLLYSTLHLAGVRKVVDGQRTDELSITLDNIRNFRQLHSPCAGHPEYGEADGIETTTGPLGQGCGNSVGMAIAAKWLSARFDRPSYELFGFNVYAVCSDGDLMEGVANEAASLAGHLQLGNLCWIYDDNGITIEGETHLAFSEDVGRRFEGLGWNVAKVEDANDLEALRKAYDDFAATDDKPTLIIVKSHIGYGAPQKQDTADAHGSPLGEDEIRATKEFYGWSPDAKFHVPDEVREHFAAGLAQRGREARESWETKFNAWSQAFPELKAEWDQMQAGELPSDWDAAIESFAADAKGVASRASSGKVQNQVAKHVPWLVGGSADLAPSTKTLISGAPAFTAKEAGRNMHFGVREHGMAAVLNGMALCHIRPYGATFLVFSDYCRPSMRLSAIMGLPVIYIFTHDSIGVGEDGPTHQPIEHFCALRAIPRMVVFRPGDANEVAAAWRATMPIKDRPVSMILTRQNLPTLDATEKLATEGVARGGYVLLDSEADQPQVILMGTGSELSVCVEAYEKLTDEGIAARVVSMPSWELFKDQDEAYRDAVLPPDVTARVAVEAGIEQGWERYLGHQGRFVGMNRFGASAPGEVLAEHFGITPQHVADVAKQVMK